MFKQILISILIVIFCQTLFAQNVSYNIESVKINSQLHSTVFDCFNKQLVINSQNYQSFNFNSEQQKFTVLVYDTPISYYCVIFSLYHITDINIISETHKSDSLDVQIPMVVININNNDIKKTIKLIPRLDIPLEQLKMNINILKTYLVKINHKNNL